MERPRSLNKSQDAAVAAILGSEFVRVILRSDPLFGDGYGAVSAWATQRKRQLFNEDPLFWSGILESEKKYYRQIVDRRFRNYYNALRVASLEGQAAANAGN
ncbi:unnamed protein product [Peniophora sp. CBMAI 1063]|nr:unnamed protein product [Peniophora sp. CBMAI 1063]